MKNNILVICILLLVCIFVVNCSKDVENEEGIDVDLSKLSATMAQAEYENIVNNSGRYIGKTIRATGTYFTTYNSTGDDFNYIIIVQGDECCQLGFEFKRNEEHIAPDDYPEPNTAIEVTGILRKGDDRIIPYIYLASAEMTIAG